MQITSNILRTVGINGAHQAECGQGCVWAGAVLGGVVGEDGGAVEGAVVLREVQPALEAVRALPSYPNADDVGGAANTHVILHLPYSKC